MRIETTEVRERKWGNLKEATGGGHKSTALNAVADYYLKMCGGTTAKPTGTVEGLMELKNSLFPGFVVTNLATRPRVAIRGLFLQPMP